jgi:hypothetical protein
MAKRGLSAHLTIRTILVINPAHPAEAMHGPAGLRAGVAGRGAGLKPWPRQQRSTPEDAGRGLSRFLPAGPVLRARTACPPAPFRAEPVVPAASGRSQHGLTPRLRTRAPRRRPDFPPTTFPGVIPHSPAGVGLCPFNLTQRRKGAKMACRAAGSAYSTGTGARIDRQAASPQGMTSSRLCVFA